MLTDLAELYGATTKAFNQAIKRNGACFPSDFMFRLTKEEKVEVVTNFDHLRNLKFSPVVSKNSILLKAECHRQRGLARPRGRSGVLRCRHDSGL